MPFTNSDESDFPVPVLAQIGRKTFEIREVFKYRRRNADPWTVVPSAPKYATTDLASVPGFLLWLVPRYGAHTLAALLHDQLVKDPPGGQRSAADDIFRDALAELQVPWLRRWIMWAAVALGTLASSNRVNLGRVLVWGAVVVLAAVFWWQHLFAGFTDLEPWSPFLIFGEGMWTDLGIIAVAAVILFPRIGLGLLAGGVAIGILPATVAVLVTFGIYLLLETLGRFVLLPLYNFLFARTAAIEAVETVPAVMSTSEEVAGEPTIEP